MFLRPFVYIVVLVLVVDLCPSSVRVVATFPGTVLFPLLCSVLPFFPYEFCSKKDRTFAIKTLLVILHFKHCPPQSSPLYWQYTVPNVSSIF